MPISRIFQIWEICGIFGLVRSDFIIRHSGFAGALILFDWRRWTLAYDRMEIEQPRANQGRGRDKLRQDEERRLARGADLISAS